MVCDRCSKVFKGKGGLTTHQRSCKSVLVAVEPAKEEVKTSSMVVLERE